MTTHQIVVNHHAVAEGELAAHTGDAENAIAVHDQVAVRGGKQRKKPQATVCNRKRSQAVCRGEKCRVCAEVE